MQSQPQVVFTVGQGPTHEQQIAMPLDDLIKHNKAEKRRSSFKATQNSPSSEQRRSKKTWVQKSGRQEKVDSMRGIEKTGEPQTQETSNTTTTQQPRNNVAKSSQAEWRKQQRLRLENQKKKLLRIGNNNKTQTKSANQGGGGVAPSAPTNLVVSTSGKNGPKKVWRPVSERPANENGGGTANKGKAFQFQAPSKETGAPSPLNITITVPNSNPRNAPPRRSINSTTTRQQNRRDSLQEKLGPQVKERKQQISQRVNRNQRNNNVNIQNRRTTETKESQAPQVSTLNQRFSAVQQTVRQDQGASRNDQGPPRRNQGGARRGRANFRRGSNPLLRT